MNLFNIICGICSVIGLFVSIFTASKVVKITQIINCNNKIDHSKVVNKNEKNIVYGSNVGRDNINGS